MSKFKISDIVTQFDVYTDWADAFGISERKLNEFKQLTEEYVDLFCDDDLDSDIKKKFCDLVLKFILEIYDDNGQATERDFETLSMIICTLLTCDEYVESGIDWFRTSPLNHKDE